MKLHCWPPKGAVIMAGRLGMGGKQIGEDLSLSHVKAVSRIF
jgi:hypothetical protein